jgi:5-methylcytosine-specific restriction enzyme subunit McrC
VAVEGQEAASSQSNRSKGGATAAEPIPSLLDLLTIALLEAMPAIELGGVYREYLHREEETSFPRGRILLGQTLRRCEARGGAPRAVVSWYERSADNGPNQLLKYAIWYLAQRLSSLRQPRAGVRRLLARLNDAFNLFAGVSLDRGRSFLSHPLVVNPQRMPSTRAYYRPAMQLALAIVRDRGIQVEGRGEDITIESLLLNLEDVFEAFLRNVLREGFRGRTGITVLDGNKGNPEGGKKLLFDAAPSEDATPDIVVRREAGKQWPRDLLARVTQTQDR